MNRPSTWLAGQRISTPDVRAHWERVQDRSRQRREGWGPALGYGQVQPVEFGNKSLVELGGALHIGAAIATFKRSAMR